MVIGERTGRALWSAIPRAAPARWLEGPPTTGEPFLAPTLAECHAYSRMTDRRMAANGDDLEKEFRKNLKLRRELHGEIAKAKANRRFMRLRWLRPRDWFLRLWVKTGSVGGLVDARAWLQWPRARNSCSVVLVVFNTGPSLTQ